MEDVHRRKGKQKEREPSVRYKECLRNYALRQGRHVTDGCCEFTPGGPEGTVEFFLCEACCCHRNFHLQETKGQITCESCYHRAFPRATASSPFLNPSPTAAVAPLMNPSPIAAMAHPVAALAIRSREDDVGVFHSPVSVQGNCGKKRFRTKFTAEQKDRMLSFSQAVGWKMQGYGDSEIKQFCEEIGVERNALRVWMHNNKHAYTQPSQPSSWAQNATTTTQSSSWAQNATAMVHSSGNQVHNNNETTATNTIINNDSTQAGID